MRWSRNEEVIERGLHYDVIIGDRHAVLIIRDVNSDDNGPYKLFAENELGTDSAIISIKISGKFSLIAIFFFNVVRLFLFHLHGIL